MAEAAAAPAAAAPVAAPAAAPAATNTVISQPLQDASAPPPAPNATDSPETKPPAEGAAAEYTEFKFPEGIEIDAKRLGDFKAWAGENKLSQDAAQKALDLYTGQLKELADQPLKVWTDTQKEWQDKVRADAEIGGTNFDPMRTEIAKALDSVGGKEAAAIREAFDITGAGNNPDIIRFIYRLTRAVNEPTRTAQGQPPSSSRNPAQVLYPTQAGLANQNLSS